MIIADVGSGAQAEDFAAGVGENCVAAQGARQVDRAGGAYREKPGTAVGGHRHDARDRRIDIESRELALEKPHLPDADGPQPIRCQAVCGVEVEDRRCAIVRGRIVGRTSECARAAWIADATVMRRKQLPSPS